MPSTQLCSVALLLFSPATAWCQATANSINYDNISHEALTLYNQRNYTGATTLLENGLATATRANRPDWQAVMLGLLGPVYEGSGKYLQAEDALNQSIDQWTRVAGPDTPRLVGPLGNLGELYCRAGQPSRAEKLLSRALSLENQNGREPAVEARLLTNLGNVYLQQNNDALAERAATEALDNVERMKQIRPELTAVYSLLGTVYFRTGRVTEAESWLRRALESRESLVPADDPLIADSAANLAMFYSQRNQPGKARPLFERARQIFETRGGDDRFMRNFYETYARFERKNGNRKEAKELSKKADSLWGASSANTLSSQIVDITALQAAK